MEEGDGYVHGRWGLDGMSGGQAKNLLFLCGSLSSSVVLCEVEGNPSVFLDTAVQGS